MTGFFIIGIVLNVVLTGLALYWLWRQRRPKPGKDELAGAAHERDQRARKNPGAGGE